jgi:hypothetical protein
LEVEHDAAKNSLNMAKVQRETFIEVSPADSPQTKAGLVAYDQRVIAAQRAYDITRDKLLRAKARLDALPNNSGLQSAIAMYDKQLIADARAIHAIYGQPPCYSSTPDIGRRKQLRPHYLAMMTAYENEYDCHPEKKGLVGLTDKTIIEFFDRYVHDSLAGFAKDATLPSDLRAIYLGGNEKYQYAALDNDANESDSEIASRLARTA